MSKDVYQELIFKLAKKYNISDLEVERIVDSQFKLLVDTMGEKGTKIVHMKYLGKFRPIKFKYKLDEINRKKETNTTESDN